MQFALLLILSEGKRKNEYRLIDSYPEIAKSLAFINEHFTENITVKEISEYAHVSISTLERNFKKTLGKTPNNYLRGLRLSRSIDLLNEGKSVSQSCFESGFRDYSLFINLFKSVYGKTPKKYQKERLNFMELK